MYVCVYVIPEKFWEFEQHLRKEYIKDFSS